MGRVNIHDRRPSEACTVITRSARTSVVTKPGRMNSLWMALDGQQVTLVPRLVLPFCYSRSRCVRERCFRQRCNVQPTRLPHSMPAFIQAQSVFLSLAPFLFDHFLNSQQRNFTCTIHGIRCQSIHLLSLPMRQHSWKSKPALFSVSPSVGPGSRSSTTISNSTSTAQAKYTIVDTHPPPRAIS